MPFLPPKTSENTGGLEGDPGHFAAAHGHRRGLAAVLPVPTRQEGNGALDRGR